MSWDSVVGWLGKGSNLQGIGSILGAGGSIYGGIKSADAANRMIDLQEQESAFNKTLILQNEKDRKRSQKAYNDTFGTGLVPLEG